MVETPTVKNIYQRFIQVQKKVTSVIKGDLIQVNARDSYKGVSHDDVAAVLHLALAEEGIVVLPQVESYEFSDFDVVKKNDRGEYTQHWYRTDIEIVVKWINADNPADFFESRGAAYALDTSDKSFAKAYSLAFKIVLLKVHLLESRDEEEKRIFEKEPIASQKPVNKSPPNNLPPRPLNHAQAAQPKASPAPPVHEDIAQQFPTDDLTAAGIPKMDDPADFIVPIGANKGKKLRELPEAMLHEGFDWLGKELGNAPAVIKQKHGVEMNVLFNFRAQIKSFLNSVGA